MKFKINSNKGMSLSTTIIAIILMIIILSSIILSVNKTSETRETMQLNNDIEELTRRVNLYYFQNGTLPIDESEEFKVTYKNEEDKDEEISCYRLLVSVFDNLNLRHKEEIKIEKDAEDNETEKLIKGYVINKETHLIYYGEINEATNKFEIKNYKYSEKYDEFLKNVPKREPDTTSTEVESGEIFTFTISGEEATVTGLTEYGKNLTELVIPKYYKGKKVTTIGDKVFLNNNNLKIIDVSNVSIIGIETFRGCENLENIINSFNITKVGVRAFYNAGTKEGIYLDLSNIIETGKNAFTGSGLKNINMIKIESIRENMFQNCTKLETVYLSKVTTIGDSAFNGCISLTSINLPKVTTISANAFAGCSALTSIDLSNATTIGEQAFLNCTSLESINMSNVTEIGTNAFVGCTSLVEIDLPKVTTISSGVFMRCVSLESINIPNVTEIPDVTFLTCTALKSIDLSNVTKIGASAFAGCSALTSIDLSKVNIIGKNAFLGCTGFEVIEIPSLCIEMGEYIFNTKTNGKVNKITIYCPGVSDTSGQPSGWDVNWAYEIPLDNIKWGESMPTS